MGPPRLGPRHRNGLPSIKCNASLPRPLSLPPPLQRIAGHPLPAPRLSSPSGFRLHKKGFPCRARVFPSGKTYHETFPPCPCPCPLLEPRPHPSPGSAVLRPRNRLRPQDPDGQRPTAPAPAPARSPVPVGCAPTPPPSTAAPFRAFPPNRAVIPSYRLLQIFFRMVGKWTPIDNAVSGIHTALFNFIYGIFS